MQRQRSIFDTFPETVDLNQGPNLNNRGMNESDELNNRLSPTERRLLSNDLNFCYETDNDHHNSRSFSSWDVGESSSRPNEQDQQDSRFKERQFDSSNTQLHDTSGSESSDHTPMDVNLNVEYPGNTANDSAQGFRFMNLYKSGGPETEASLTSEECETDCSFGNWGLSCKRKALEGSTSGSSSCNNGSTSATPVVNAVNTNAFLSPSVPGPAESSRRYGNPGGLMPSRRLPHSEYLGQSQTSRGGPILTSQPNHLHPFPDTTDSRNGSSSRFRSGLRNEQHSSYFGPSNNLVQDPTNWSLATGRSSVNGGNSSRNDNIWMPHMSSMTNGQQRLTELPPWTLFPSSEGAADTGHRAHFPSLPPGSSSVSEENVLPSRGRNRQPFLRPASLMEVPGDEWQAFTADIEGRHRLVSEMRQILNALRRGESLRAEDYMLFDPFINGVPELHDRHRDMRLDVDNMSYEELLALEERIGDVKTGLSEEVILKSMKQRKHIHFMAISAQHLEPCCICREEYVNGDDIGTLDCGHDFHTYCIKQWLSQKNLCPICKMTGLST